MFDIHYDLPVSWLVRCGSKFLYEIIMATVSIVNYNVGRSVDLLNCPNFQIVILLPPYLKLILSL